MERTLAKDTPKRIGQKISVSGWVHARRDHGKIIFVDLRDRSGLVQIVFSGDILAEATDLRPEYVVTVVGEVKERPASLVNPNLESGTVELSAEEVTVHAEAITPPFPLDTDGYEIDEELRLRYRYLDLRRDRLQKNVRKRAEVARFIRHFLDALGFCEVETPYITKGTPEGAREFAVPSRLHPGKFYVLPQSPQQFKQLLMVAGLERYYQLARIFRDEDPRADRSYGEATQIDMEISFVTQEEILAVVEEMAVTMVRDLFPDKRITAVPFPRIPYAEALKKWKTDKPDLREHKDDRNELAFAFIVDWPAFEWNKMEKRWDPHHHIFTAPRPEDIPLLVKDPGKVRSLQHDFVLNGLEIGGGSIRITDPAVQEQVFELVGIEKEEGKSTFAHMLEAFRYGVPPHGGIAIGLDRMLIPLTGEANLREVMAFPKTGDGRDLMMGAPSVLPPKKIRELHIQPLPPKK
jgi:aspartyl-tRNA synthetase